MRTRSHAVPEVDQTRVLSCADAPQQPVRPWAPSDTDTVAWNVAKLACVAAVACVFLNATLSVGVVGMGVVAPAWRTVRVLERGDEEGRRDWLAYWVVVAFGVVLKSFLGGLPFVPKVVENAAMLVSVVWLTRGDARNARGLYEGFVRPGFGRLEERVDGVVEGCVDVVDEVSSRAIVAVNDAVHPYFQRLERAAEVTRAQIQVAAEEETRNRGVRYIRGGWR